MKAFLWTRTQGRESARILDTPFGSKDTKWKSSRRSIIVKSGPSPVGEKFRLVRRGRDSYLYEDEERAVELQIDMLSGDPQRVIYMSTMLATQKAGASPKALESSEQRALAERIAAHLRKEGYSVEIQD